MMTEVQQVILSIFKEIDAICRKHGIPYFAIGGTCIGAIRHQGFIPWDDDLDIAIPIEHFDRFLEIAGRELPDSLYVYTGDQTRHYHYVWAKVCDKRTAFIEASEYRYEDAYKGIFVDVMPISGVPAEPRKQKVFVKRLYCYNYLNGLARFPIDASARGLNRLSKVVIKAICSLMPMGYFSKKYLRILKKHPFQSAEYTGYTWSSNLGKLVFPVSWFSDGVDMAFEDTAIRCPSDYHRYLTAQFGDYMTPPSREAQAVHSGVVDVRHPYPYYYGKLKG